MSHLVSAAQLAELLPDEAGSWLVLERHSQTFERLYALESAPDIAWLFHDTRYAALADQSPLVVRVSPGSALLEAFAAGQGAPPLEGILVSSTATPARVLAQLRKRLDIRFYGKRQALLRYYDPWVAAAFFSADEALNSWLGPLERVIWFGGTFAQRAQRGACWYACSATPEVTAVVEPDDVPGLTHAQESELEDLLAHYPLWRHLVEQAALDETSAEHAKRFLSALGDAARLSIPQQDLADFLVLRIAHHQAALPETWVALPADKRLAMLKRHFDIKEDETTIGRDWA
ncbi:DUF4123 domain-containing protein [Halomonas salifodinae]|uniref:DUF4123 domain-containing protein n=1 Tax=Halomonas salifodinae TaxID=438745 RepID=UPI00339DB1B2